MQDGGEMAADARCVSQMVNAFASNELLKATARTLISVLGASQSPSNIRCQVSSIDVWLPLLRHKVATLDLNTADGAGTLLELFAQAKNDYLCEYT
jgi:hypothetical protein